MLCNIVQHSERNCLSLRKSIEVLIKIIWPITASVVIRNASAKNGANECCQWIPYENEAKNAAIAMQIVHTVHPV